MIAITIFKTSSTNSYRLKAFWSGNEHCVEMGFMTNFYYRYPKNGKTAEPPAVNSYFSNFLFNLGKIDLPRITHAKFQMEIRILSAICSLITRLLH